MKNSMKLKRMLLNFLMMLAFTNAGFSQSNSTFDKLYGNLELINPVSSFIKETSDGGCIVAGLEIIPLSDTTVGTFFFKIDKRGKGEWLKKINGAYYSKKSSQPIVQTKDDGYLAVVNKNTDNDNALLLLRYNSIGDSLWLKDFSDTLSGGTAFGIIESNDGNYLVYGGLPNYDRSGFSKSFILKIDGEGNILQKKYYSQYSDYAFGYRLNQKPDSGYVISSSSSFLVLGQDADSLKTLQRQVGHYNIASDNNLVIVNGPTLSKYDFNGNLLWQHNIGMNGEGVVETEDGKFIINGVWNNNHSTIFKVDSLGNTEWIDSLRGKASYVNVTSGKEIIMAGNYYSLILWLCRIDGNGFYSEITINNPKPGEDLYIYHDYNISWYTHNVDYLNIDYSTDGGNRWEGIITRYPAELHYFKWSVPNAPSKNCRIRISESGNQSKYTVSDSPFSIEMYSTYEYIAANEIKMWIGNNGDGSHSPLTDAQGLFWPGGEEATQGACYEDGPLFGGKVNGQVRISGSSYRHGLRPGIILDNGNPDSSLKPEYKQFKIKKDWEYLQPGPERDKLEYDYSNWPGSLGAPFIDVDGDGKYTKDVDRPDFIGDEVLYSVANDKDSNITKFLYGTLPMELEIHTTVYALNGEIPLKNTVFKRYKFINKGDNEIKDMYISYWQDDDLGDANDDYVGCDTLLSLAYTYNGRENDGVYGNKVPAIGHMFLQTPITKSEAGDSAWYEGKWKKGYKNVPFNSFVLFIGANSTYRDATLGSISGTKETYNYMQGFIWDGSPIIDPNTKEATKFCLSGDPAAGIGWYEGTGWPNSPTGGPGDRRSLISAGPFNMFPGDTNEVVFAIFLARGSNNINSITELKNAGRYLQRYFRGETVTAIDETANTPPKKYELYQNFPNPFNPATIIKYQLAEAADVTLKIFDILGREVKTLINKHQAAGNYKIEFNADGLASGMYIYRLKAGNYMGTKKMILLR